jgi:hypothetical protein
MNINDTTKSLADAVANIMGGHSAENVELNEAKTVPFEKMNILTPDQWDEVQNFKNFDGDDWKWNAIQKKFIRLKKVEEDAVEEGNEFTAAAAKAKLAGKDEFEFDGKTYPVEIEKDAAEKILGKSESVDLDEEVSQADIKKILAAAKKAGGDIKGNQIDFGMGAVIDVSIEKGKIKLDAGRSNGVEYFKTAKDAVMAFESVDFDLTEATNTVDIKTPTEFAAKRLEKNLNNKWSGYTFVRKGTVVTVPNERFVIRYIEKQPEFEGVAESVDLDEAIKWWTVTVTKKAGKLFKGQTVDVKASNSAEAIKKGLKQMKADPMTVPSGSVDAVLGESKLKEAKISQGAKNAEDAIDLLGRNLKVGSNLQKGLEKSSGSDYKADFKKMQDAMTIIDSIYSAILMDVATNPGMNEVEEPKSQGEKNFKALHTISATDPEEAGNDQPIAPRP